MEKINLPAAFVMLVMSVFFSIKVFRRSSIHSAASWLQVVSPVLLAVFLASEYLFGKCAVVQAGLAGIVMLLCSTMCEAPLAARFCSLGFFFLSSVAVVGLCPDCVFPMLVISCLVAVSIYRTAVKFSNPKKFVRTPTIYYVINDSIFDLILIVTMFLASLCIVAGMCPERLSLALRLSCALLSCGLFVFLGVRNLTGEMLSFGREHMRALEEAAYREVGLNSLGPASVDITDIYERLVRYFEERQVYLNPDLNIVDLSREIYTNKTYLSKAISKCFKGNFCRFVNHYRISYAVECFKKDPSLRVGQLVQMSGFRSEAAFSMAFRIEIHETPSTWMKNYRSKVKK